MKIAVGSDHAGYEMKKIVVTWLEEHGHEVQDFGTDSSYSADSADFVHPLANALEKGEFEFGILICGSGQRVSFTTNKHQGIRAALCWNSEVSKLSRQHNNANILCIPGRFLNVQC